MLPIESYIGQFKGKTIALSVYDLETGMGINFNADEPFHPASTIKVPIMLAVFERAEAGSFSLDDRVDIRNESTSIAGGSPFSLDIADDSDKSLYDRIGGTETIRELIRLMIVRSSNLATNILLGLVGAARVTEFMVSLGVQGISVIRGMEDKAAFHAGLNNSATARGLTHMIRMLAERKVISKRASDEMIEMMLGQESNECIPALLPASARVAHKTGWTGENYHDTGIVFPPNRKPYAITILTRGFPEDDETQAHTCIAEISRLVFERICQPARQTNPRDE
jgi:beta-lactamase class A